MRSSFHHEAVGQHSQTLPSSIVSVFWEKSIEKIDEVNSAIILIDAKEGIDRQDKRIIDKITQKVKETQKKILYYLV